MRRAFTLVEILVVIAIIAVLIGILLPTLGSAREAGRAAVCQSNLRQMMLVTQMYADANRGYGPGIGAPYTEMPHWGPVMLEASGVNAETPKAGYSTRSFLVCPSAEAVYKRGMTRTYAVNATGHAGLPGDPDHYDTGTKAKTVHVRVDRVVMPATAVAYLDSAAIDRADGPPLTQCSSVLDFRQADHVEKRIGHFHGGKSPSTARFHAVMYGGGVGPHAEIDETWKTPLP